MSADRKPPEVPEAPIRLKSGLKKALLWGAIGVAAAVGIGLFVIGPQMLVGGGLVDFFVGTSFLKTAGVAGLAIPAAAAAAGFLMGTTDDRPVLQAKAEARRGWLASRIDAPDGAQLEMDAREQAAENEKHKFAMGTGTPGGYAPPSFTGPPGAGNGKNRGSGLLNF